jgi:hypothetical protein
MTIAEIKDLVLFMKGECVESFEVDYVKVNFHNAAFLEKLLSDPKVESKSAADIEQEEEDNLYAST